MELDTHIARMSSVAERVEQVRAKLYENQAKIHETHELHIFSPEVIKADMAALRVMGRMGFELALLTPHIPEIYKLKKETDALMKMNRVH